MNAAHVESAEQDALVAVGIAASAGGLEALTLLLRALPSHQRLSFVVAQHLSPHHPSMLATLLERESQMAVREAMDGDRLTGGEVLVIPPGHNAHLEDRRLCLTPAERQNIPKPSANEFFTSLADAFGDHALAVVLSGTGSDGSHGVRYLKAKGGFVLAQDPDEARYSGMPKAAIDTGCVDRILGAEGIAHELVRLASLSEGDIHAHAESLAPDTFDRLLTRLARRTGVDFHAYKEATLRRRLARRMVATHCASLEEYEPLLDRHPEELDSLFQDVLISVTAFYRDTTAFETLHKKLVERLAGKAPGDEIRVWVAGCATGEEAYSLAILLNEILGHELIHYRLQLFATDIDMRALAIARKGRYDRGALKGLPGELVERYFHEIGDVFVVNKALREQVIFARQDLTQDPPFLRLDLLTCRNVLIYLRSSAQKQIIKRFHYALAANGLLLLGKSESLPDASFFTTCESQAKLYRRRDNVESPALPASRRTRPSPPARAMPASRPAPQRRMEERVMQALIRHRVPAGMVLDTRFDIHYVFGDVSPFAKMAAGRPSLNVQQLLDDSLHIDVKALTYKAIRENQPQRSRRMVVGDREVQLGVLPLPVVPGEEALQLLIFDILTPTAAADGGIAEPRAGDEGRASELERELSATREHLQTVVEELETSNEELQSVNEEMQSGNEELQSTNEEMETANEELQSSNEELLTVNEELQSKTSELSQALGDLENIKNALPAPLLVVDRNGRLTLYNPTAQQLFALTGSQLGQPLYPLQQRFKQHDIDALVSEVIEQGRVRECQLNGERRYRLVVSPHLDDLGVVDGAVLLLWDNTELSKATEDLAASLRQTRLQAKAMEAASQGIAIAEISPGNQPLVYVNPAFTRITGFSESQVIGRNCNFLQGEGTSQASRAQLREAIASGEETNVTLLNYRSDGRPFWNQLHLSPVKDDDGTLTHYIGLQFDTSNEVENVEQQRLAATVFDSTQEGINITDPQGLVISVNPAFTEITGYTRDEVVGQPITGLHAGEEHSDFYDEQQQQLSERGVWQGEVTCRRKNGEIYPEMLTINPVFDDDGRLTHYVRVFRDISEIKQNQERLSRMAHYDPLTGLANRLLFNERLAHAIERAKRHGHQLGVMFMDIDHFKRINDSLGHGIGDELLVALAERLSPLLRKEDTLGRLGGDEFVLLLEENVRPALAQSIAIRLNRTLNEPFIIQGQHIAVSASIGVAIYPHDGEDSESLLRNADGAMYAAKNAGRGRHAFTDPELSRTLQEQLLLENDLREALSDAHGGLFLEYQPQVDVVSHEVVGLEALIRWQHPTLGRLPPDRFIPLARSLGLGTRLDHWVLGEAIAQHRLWQADASPLSDIALSVNIMPERLSAENCQSYPLDAMLREHIDPPSGFARLDWLILEITEEGLLSKSSETLKAMKRLRALGVGLAIDDFGVGYSNFSHIAQLPVTQVKLDRSLISRLDELPHNQVLVEGLGGMLEKLKMSCVAEGVETARVASQLRSLGIHTIQGYHIARPMSASDLESWIAQFA